MSISERTLVKVQAGTGAVLGCFTAIHLSGHVLSHFGLGASDAWMRLFRNIYQASPVVELAIVAAGTVHAAVGFIRLMRRRERQRALHASKVRSILI